MFDFFFFLSLFFFFPFLSLSFFCFCFCLFSFFFCFNLLFFSSHTLSLLFTLFSTPFRKTKNRRVPNQGSFAALNEAREFQASVIPSLIPFLVVVVVVVAAAVAAPQLAVELASLRRSAPLPACLPACLPDMHQFLSLLFYYSPLCLVSGGWGGGPSSVVL